MLPKLQECLQDAANTSDVFMSSASHLKRLYVTYCLGKRRSEDIIGDNMDTLKVTVCVCELVIDIDFVHRSCQLSSRTG